jgi:hypothetical protein
MDIVELLPPCGFDTLEYSYVKATIDICMLIDYSMTNEMSVSFLPPLPGIAN